MSSGRYRPRWRNGGSHLWTSVTAPIRLERDTAGPSTTLERFGGALGGSSSSFSLVLLGPMLWTRFAGDDGGLRAQVHVAGPTPGDLVLVSELIVIQAIADGRLAVGEAHREGLIRLYGSDEQRTRFLASYGTTADITRTTGGSL